MTSLTDPIEEVSPIGSGDLTTVRAETTSTHGRFIVSANAKHFVSDARASVGGPGEAVQAGELLLSALASCGLGLIQAHAKKEGLDLGQIGIATSFKRHADDPTRYDYIRLLVSFDGHVSKDISDACIRNFTDNCPIYNTLRRGGPISIERAKG